MTAVDEPRAGDSGRAPLRRVEQALRASEERMQLAMNVADAATWDYDLVTGALHWSESHFRLLGLPPNPSGEAKPQMWEDAVDPRDIERLRQEWERAAREHALFLSEHRMYRADGTMLWARAAGRFFYDDTGRAIRFVGVFFDITDRKRSEQLEREHNRALELVASGRPLGECLEALTEAAARLEPGLRTCVVVANPDRTEVAQVVGAQLPPSFAEGIRGAPIHAIPVGTCGATIHVGHPTECVDVAGNVEWTPAWTELCLAHGIRACTSTPVFGEAGRAVASFMLCLDEPREITDWERRIAEFAAHMAGIAIERDRTVAALAETERQMRLEAEERAREESRRKDEFLATLAHELRNPLAPVRHGLDVLRMPHADPDMRARVVDMMERQLAHMVRLVDDLLEVSRITRGKIELRRETVDIASVVRSALEAAAPVVEAGHHRLSVNLLAEPVLVDGDPVRLAQVIGNLLNNAAKYTEDGGHIRVTVARHRGNAVISVRDTGIGIAADMLPHVFELFTQIDRTSGRAQGGLGIGLALVANLVRMHGGAVEAHSDGPGRGSEFVVRLPLTPADARRVAAQGRTEAEGGVSTRPILVVDDNRDAADSLSMVLELAGREVCTAYDGRAGLEVIRREHPEVVFLDLGMPGMDGYAVASAVRGDPDLCDVKLVALTGWGSDEDRRRSHDAGFDHHLVKPVDARTVETLLNAFARA